MPKYEPLEDLDLNDDYKTPPPTDMHLRSTDGTLQDLNLDKELYRAYVEASNYLELIKHDENTPANQVAQVLNSMTTILKEITKMQAELYNAERIKNLEAAMVYAIKKAPEDIREAFLIEYEKIIGNLENGL